MRIFNKKDTQKKATTKLPMTGKVRTGFRRYCVAVLALTMVLGTSMTAFAANDPIKGCRHDYARLRHCAGWLVAEIPRPFPEGERLSDPCRRRCHYLCKGDSDPHHGLREKTAY